VAHSLFTIGFLLLAPVWADVPNDANEQEEAVESPRNNAPLPLVIPSPQSRLEAAVVAYQISNYQAAISILSDLAVNEDTPTEVRQEARIYLGEIRFVQDDEIGAQRFFEQVLSEDPNYRIDRFKHPPDVCSHFDYVRAYMADVATVIEPTPPAVFKPMPIQGYLPMGIYQFQHNQTRQGTILLVGQATTVLTSMVLFGILWADHEYPAGDDIRHNELVALQRIQWTSTAAYYGFRAFGIAKSQRHWRLNMAFQNQDGVASTGLNASGSF